MTLLLIGHRGCGKTSLLARISVYLPGRTLLDLDREIERRQQMTVDRIFEERGEAVFRGLERECLERLVASHADPVVALGAGYSGPLPAGCRCLWVRRDLDREGRVFLDRPRLEADLDPIAEYRKRFEQREAGYRARAERVLTLRQGYLEPTAVEAAWFRGTLAGVGGALTVLPENLADLEHWLAERLAWGVGLFEVRDDLLAPDQIARVTGQLPADRILYSYRRPGGPGHRPAWRSDWDLELGPCPEKRPDILSLHCLPPGAGVAAAGARLVQAGAGARLLKLAPHTDTFRELEAGHRWFREDPAGRVFLPRSSQGRWAWYRLLLGRRVGLNFFREGNGSCPDQPLLLDWAERTDPVDRFAAILGDPVAHSRTPAEQAAWFDRYGMPVYALALTASEWEGGALEFLRCLGLRAAAVTAPHKPRAWASSGRRTPAAEALKALNTLAWDETTCSWSGESTDGPGFAAALAELCPQGETAIWGGGGTLAMLCAALPGAGCYAARTGQLRAGSPVAAPALLVWATDRPGASPPDHWRPATLLDLSYRQDSPGLRYALETGARYVSGLIMFREQARLQRLFWQEYLR